MSLASSTCSPAGTPANHSATQDNEKEKTTNATSGLKSLGSFATYDPDLCCWRTSAGTFPWGSDEYLETWPRAGMTRNGTAYQRLPLAPLTSVTGFSYLPTPDASLGTFSLRPQMDVTTWLRKEERGTRKSGANIGSSLRWHPEFIQEHLRTGGELNPEWLEVLMGLPIGWSALKP